MKKACIVVAEYYKETFEFLTFSKVAYNKYSWLRRESFEFLSFSKSAHNEYWELQTSFIGKRPFFKALEERLPENSYYSKVSQRKSPLSKVYYYRKAPTGVKWESGSLICLLKLD